MDLIIKNTEYLSKDQIETIQDVIAGSCDVISCDQMRALCNWRLKFKERHGFDPVHIDLIKVIDLIKTGEINDHDLVVELNQKTLERFKSL